MTSPHRQLQVCAETICGSLPHLWRPEWRQVHTPGLPQLLGEIYEPYGRLADAVTRWWDDPSREGWDSPAHHPDTLSANAGWDCTDSLGWHDPLLPASSCRHWISELEARLRWWRLAPHATAILHALEHGRPPARNDLDCLAGLVDAGQADGTIATPTDGTLIRDSGPCPDSDKVPLTFGELGISKRQVAEARDVA